MQPTRAVINDQNKELINCYEVVRDSLDDLIEELREHQEHNSADYFYEIRDLDRSPENYKSLSAVKRAARIIYLNKTTKLKMDNEDAIMVTESDLVDLKKGQD